MTDKITFSFVFNLTFHSAMLLTATKLKINLAEFQIEIPNKGQNLAY